MAVPPTALNEIRRILRQRRRTISKETNFRRSLDVGTVLTEAVCIGLYRPMGGEPDPFPLIATFRGMTSLPALSDGDPMMTFRRWSTGEALVTSSWGGQQPPGTAEPVIPDLIFVPMLGFDAGFNRIGQGGGHYDRYLAAHPTACRIGIAWEGQRVDTIEAQPWDVPMDAIVTEAAFYAKDLTRCQHP